MEPLNGDENCPQVSLEQRAASELIKRIRKLRWMGLEDEAQALQGALRHAHCADSVVAYPLDTD